MRKNLIVIALLALLPSIVFAQASALQGVCSNLFGQEGSSGALLGGNAGLSSLTDFSTYNFMLGFCLLIIMAVFMVLAIMYGIGYAFGINRIITFVRTEYLESILNLIIVVLLFGGIAVLADAISFITNLGASIVVASGAPTVSGFSLSVSGSNVATIQQVYNSICSVYTVDAGLHFAGLVLLSSTAFIYSIVSGITVLSAPNGMGITFTPFDGITPFQHVISFMTPLISGTIIVELGIVFFLAIVYYLFPLFLFLGVLLRSLPWTRAAGGTLLALFIGFYLFFPALLYPFAAVQYRCLAVQLSSCNVQFQQYLNLPPVPTDIAGVFGTLQSVPGGLGTFFAEGQFVALLDYWVFSIVNASFQIFGIVISFVVSYSLLEGFADLLGAPSLQAKNLMRNVI